MKELRVKALREGACLPSYGSDGAAGADLTACIPEVIEIQPGQTVFVPTGISLEIPEGFAGLVYARSGLSCKQGLAPANKVGVIDSDYRGEIMVALYNHGSQMQPVENGQRIAQLVITPVERVSFQWGEDLSQTERAAGGFGSTGK